MVGNLDAAVKQALNAPELVIDPEILEKYEGMVLAARQVPGRGLCVVMRFIGTAGLLVDAHFGANGHDYGARYCYDLASEACFDLAIWDGQSLDPPGDWLKEKVSERLGPGARVSDDERARHEERRRARIAKYGHP